MVSGESTYGETHLGNADVLNPGGEVIAVGRLSAMKYLDAEGESRWHGHFTAVAPPNAVDDLDGEFILRLGDGTQHLVMIEQELNSQLAPGVQLSVTGLGAPPY